MKLVFLQLGIIICFRILQKCQILKEKVAALEEQLVDLDQQHQAALDVAISSRDQLKEDNRQLQLQLMQLLNDRQTVGYITHFYILTV